MSDLMRYETALAGATLSELGQVILQDAYGAERDASEDAVFNGNAAPLINGVNARSEVARAMPVPVDDFAKVVTAVESLVDSIYAGRSAESLLADRPGQSFAIAESAPLPCTWCGTPFARWTDG